MKKTVSTVLIAAMLASGAGSAFAWVPTDLDDPKCINLKNFGNGPQKIVKGRKFCGCKTFEFTAITYDKLDDYLYSVIFELNFF